MSEMSYVSSVEAFLSSGLVSRSALLGEERFVFSDIVGEEAAPKTDAAGGCGAVDVWRHAYEHWCDEHGMEVATPAAFGRGVRSTFGLKSVPCGKRASVDGHKVQYRVFVDGPYEGGSQRSGRPRKHQKQTIETASYVKAVPAPSDGGLFANTLSHFDVESYLARKAQLEAYISCGYVSDDHERVVYDGWSGVDGAHFGRNDIPFLQSFGDIFYILSLTGGMDERLRVTRTVQSPQGLDWNVTKLPLGEYLVESSAKLPVPDGQGGQSVVWCRLVCHVRCEGVAHYGEDGNAALTDEYEISEGDVFPDDCLLGMTLSIFENADGFGGGQYSREFTFDIPTTAFQYMGLLRITSGFALRVLGDQYDVGTLVRRCENVDGDTTERELIGNEPDFPVVYAPQMRHFDNGDIDYAFGRPVKNLGTYPIVKQVSARTMFGGIPTPVKAPYYD